MGCHSLLQGDLPDPGIETRSLELQADSLLSETPEKPWRRPVESNEDPTQPKKKKEQFKNKEEGDLKDALVGEGERDCLDAERRQERFGKGKPRTEGGARAHLEAG